jgi:hypothetical protein
MNPDTGSNGFVDLSSEPWPVVAILSVLKSSEIPSESDLEPLSLELLNGANG